jgi:RsiW-degrading membrane proteinase PrsW (M82 family)
MNFSALQLMVVILVPVLLTGMVWRVCRPKAQLGTIAWSFLLGVIIVWPVIHLSNLLAGKFAGMTGHYYFDELLEVTLATAVPEEIGKGSVAFLFIRLAGTPKSPLAWLAFGAAAHSGFAALEGILSSLGNEGVVKVLIGRSLGALSHCSWGIIMTWFGWRGWTRRNGKWGNWAATLLIPVLLHATTNASLVDVPGASNSPDGEIPTPALMIMLSGLAALAASVVLSGYCLVRSRRIDAPPEEAAQN